MFKTVPLAYSIKILRDPGGFESLCMKHEMLRLNLFTLMIKKGQIMKFYRNLL